MRQVKKKKSLETEPQYPKYVPFWFVILCQRDVYLFTFHDIVYFIIEQINMFGEFYIRLLLLGLCVFLL